MPIPNKLYLYGQMIPLLQNDTMLPTLQPVLFESYKTFYLNLI